MSDDGLEVGHHFRKGVRATNGAEDIVRVLHALRPVAHCGIDCVFESGCALCDRNDGCAQLFHPEDVGSLSFDIECPHVNRAI